MLKSEIRYKASNKWIAPLGGVRKSLNKEDIVKGQCPMWQWWQLDSACEDSVLWVVTGRWVSVTTECDTNEDSVELFNFSEKKWLSKATLDVLIREIIIKVKVISNFKSLSSLREFKSSS